LVWSVTRTSSPSATPRVTTRAVHPQLNEKAAALLREWVSACTSLTTRHSRRWTSASGRGGEHGGRAALHPATAAFDAKDRYGLPEAPLDWLSSTPRPRPAVANPRPCAPSASARPSSSPEGGREGRRGAGPRRGHTTRLAQLNSWINAKLAEASDRTRAGEGSPTRRRRLEREHSSEGQAPRPRRDWSIGEAGTGPSRSEWTSICSTAGRVPPCTATSPRRPSTPP
jgi:hypothetical protein